MPGREADERELCQRVRTVCAANRLRAAARGVTQRYDAALAPSGLRVTQLPILVALRLTGPVPITPLADTLGLDRTTLTRNLRLLVGRGFVAMSADGDDARVRMAALTGEGAAALAQALELWDGVQRAVEAEFGRPRLLDLYGELAALSAATAS
jgi:DNA-binding MarR family transcriptional regulator